MALETEDRITLREIAAYTHLTKEELRMLRELLADIGPERMRSNFGGINVWTFLTFVTVLTYVVHHW